MNKEVETKENGTTQQQSTDLAMPERRRDLTNVGVFDDVDSFEFALRQSKMLASSTLVPKAFQGNISNCMVAIELAQRLRMSRLEIMQSLNVIHGKPSFSSSFIIAKINASGRYKLPLQFALKSRGDNRQCIAWTIDHHGTRLEGPPVSIKMAKAEGWYGRDHSKWPTMPDLMLSYRAAAFFGRLYVPELLMGMQTMEELQDIPTPQMREINPAPTPQSEIKGTAGVAIDINAAILKAKRDLESEIDESPEPETKTPESKDKPEQTPQQQLAEQKRQSDEQKEESSTAVEQQPGPERKAAPPEPWPDQEEKNVSPKAKARRGRPPKSKPEMGQIKSTLLQADNMEQIEKIEKAVFRYEWTEEEETQINEAITERATTVSQQKLI